MRQGEATSSRMGATKPDQMSTKINPGGVGQIGIAQGVERAVEPIVMGKGAQAPAMNSCTSHACGSQGRR